MELNLTTIGYLFFRLAPFILVCFFSLASLFNQDFKGLVYLIGLIITCAVFILFGNSTGEYLKNKEYYSMNDIDKLLLHIIYLELTQIKSNNI
jgi:hypothetical protein